MTITGLVFIPLSLVIILMDWRYCFFALVVSTVFPTAAVINVGSFGLQPSYFFSLLIILRTTVEMVAGRQPFDRFVLTRLSPLMFFVILAVFVLWCALVFFHGNVIVLSSEAKFVLEAAAPYQFARTNVTQLLYLGLNLATMYCLAHHAIRMSPRKFSQTVDWAIIVSIVAAAAFIVWEMLSQRFHVPFPTGFLLSNASYEHSGNTLSSTTFGLWRRSGSFAEPSGAAYFLAGSLFFSWQRYRVKLDLLSIVLVLLVLFSLYAVKSTSGYLVILIFLAIVASKSVWTFLARLGSSELTFTRNGLIIAGVLALASILATAHIIEDFAQFRSIIDQMLLTKGQSVSFAQRTGADLMAIEITQQTFGLGVGLGSHKANSLVLTVLSNVGVLGLIAIGAFFYGILWPHGEGTTRHLQEAVGSPLRWFVYGLLIVHAISNPNLNSANIWIISGLLLGTAAIFNRVTIQRVSQT